MFGVTRRRVPLERWGSAYGGWVVPAGALDGHSVVISAGVGDDTSFDEAIIARFDCCVIGVDPTPAAARHIVGRRELPRDRFVLVRKALADSVGSRHFYPPRNPEHVSYSLVADARRSAHPGMEVATTTCASLARETQIIGAECPALIKLDIEGAESEVLADVLRHGPNPPVLCVEFDRAGVHHTARDIVRLLRGGYRVVAVEGLNVSFNRR